MLVGWFYCVMKLVMSILARPVGLRHNTASRYILLYILE